MASTELTCVAKGYELLEEDTQISLKDFADKYAREDGDVEYEYRRSTLSVRH
jgi:hypothetical protein